MCGLHGDRLHEWIARVEADQLPDLHSFTAGLKRDLDAVANGLSMPYSSGASRATSTASRCSNARCMAAPASTCFETGPPGYLTSDTLQHHSTAWSTPVRDGHGVG
jgi:hypothetical protein